MKTKQTILPATSNLLTTFSKKQIKEAAVSAAATVSPASGVAMAKRLAAFAASVIAELKDSLSSELTDGDVIEAEGCRIYFKGGGFRYSSPMSYQHDPVWCELKAALDAREELMKLASKQKLNGPIFDSEGAEIPQAIELPVSPSLMCDF